MKAALVGAAILYGVPQKKRELGQAEGVKPFGVEDNGWPYREYNDGKLELTQVPVRLPKNINKISNEVVEASEENVDVLVMGGAAAGLAAAACLQHEGLSVVVIEKNERAGDIWRSRYHRLHLHDIIDECHLPFMPMPDSYPVYPSRHQFARYLDAYQVGMDIDVRNLHVVEHADRDDKSGFWKVKVKNCLNGNQIDFQCRHFVIANGIYNDPLLPPVPYKELFKGKQLHSSRYTNAKDLGLVGKRVLIVGWGNSGCEIAVDLVEHGAKPTLLARDPQVILPRFAIQLSQQLIYTHLKPLSKIPFGWIFFLPTAVALEALLKLSSRLHYGMDISELGFKQHWLGPIFHFVVNSQPPVMDIGTVQSAKEGKLRVTNSGLKEFSENGVIFEDGAEEEYDAIVWATGYKIFSGHEHIFTEEMAKRVGLGTDVIKAKRILPGSEHPDVKGLWHMYGRLQMIRDAAPPMARAILKSTPGKVDLHPKGLLDGWAWFIFKHILVLGAYRSIQNRRSKL